MSPGFAIEPIVNHTCLLGEGPVWDTKRKIVCWVDILNGEIHEYSPGNKTHHTIHVHQMIGSIALCTNGQYLAALQHGFAFVNRLTGAVNMISDPESHLPNNRFNEGKCDPAGRFWSGTMSLSEDKGAGNVYILRDKLDHSKVIEGVSISNGLSWTKNNKVLYYIDTPTHNVVAYDFDIDSGGICNKRNVISIDAKEGFPDGMTIDNEDKLWIAHWDGWCISRWDPEKGEKLMEIIMPVARVTSCTFGGDNYKDLFITSACIGLSDEALQTQPLAGSLFVIRDCGYTGLPAVSFKL